MISGTLAISGTTTNGLLLESSSCSRRFHSVITCTAPSPSFSPRNNHHDYKIPKLEPFSRTKIERAVKDPPLIEKSETQLADYCSTLEGDDSSNCWQAYFELKDLEKESPKAEVERLIIEAGGVKSLIGYLHGVAAIHKAKKERLEAAKAAAKVNEDQKVHLHVPDGLPRSREEMEEEEKARMPDSPYTRMLRLRGKYPAWYSPAPDHDTD